MNGKSPQPIFSIISPALNCREFLPRHIASVQQQAIPPTQFEHWIIDGGSTDGTLGYLRQQKTAQFISEPDRGLSHAVNKGLQRARGQWIIWLNVDDELAPNALASFLSAIESSQSEKIVIGAQEVRGYDGRTVTISQPWAYSYDGLLRQRTEIIQASTFVHRTVYESIGGMDETFRYAMDYEWMVRATRRYTCQTIPPILTIYHMRKGSITDGGIANQHREFLRVRRDHGCPPLELMEFKCRFYLATEPFRSIPWLRASVQRLKRKYRKLTRSEHAAATPSA